MRARLWLGCLLAFCGGAAMAQDYPTRTVTMIVPSAPGGTLDALGRLMAQAMSPDLGRTVVIENVTGAGSLVGMQRLVRSDPEGYVIGFGNVGSMAANVATTRDLGFDPRTDLTPISIVANVPMVLAASPRSGLRDLATLVSRIRERGEGVTFGTGGAGTTGHLAPAFLFTLIGAKGMLVPYRGAGPAMSDLAAGTVDVVIDQTVTMIPAHLGRTAVALAVTGNVRAAQLPGRADLRGGRRARLRHGDLERHRRAEGHATRGGAAPPARDRGGAGQPRRRRPLRRSGDHDAAAGAARTRGDAAADRRGRGPLAAGGAQLGNGAPIGARPRFPRFTSGGGTFPAS
jgi:tripartite-type tricarboxylate transporter receptor subunit TctC